MGASAHPMPPAFQTSSFREAASATPSSTAGTALPLSSYSRATGGAPWMRFTKLTMPSTRSTYTTSSSSRSSSRTPRRYTNCATAPSRSLSSQTTSCSVPSSTHVRLVTRTERPNQPLFSLPKPHTAPAMPSCICALPNMGTLPSRLRMLI